MTQGDRVKDVRKTLKLTLEEFGKKVGVTKQTVSRIENGINNLTDQMVKSICREFNVNYDWLMDEEGEMFSDLPQTVLDELCSQYELDDLDRFIVELYVGLPKDVRDGIKARAKDLIQKRNASEEKKLKREPIWIPFSSCRLLIYVYVLDKLIYSLQESFRVYLVQQSDYFLPNIHFHRLLLKILPFFSGFVNGFGSRFRNCGNRSVICASSQLM